MSFGGEALSPRIQHIGKGFQLCALHTHDLNYAYNVHELV